MHLPIDIWTAPRRQVCMEKAFLAKAFWANFISQRQLLWQSYIQMMAKSQSYVGVTPGVHLWWTGSNPTNKWWPSFKCHKVTLEWRLVCTCGGKGAILHTNDGQAPKVTKLRWSDAWCALVVEREQCFIGAVAMRYLLCLIHWCLIRWFDSLVLDSLI